jgi:tetratricopeptide (TPR) repeat protein
MKILLALIAGTVLAASYAFGAGSSTYTPSVAPEIKAYNEGVRLMLDKEFAEAENRFRAALTRKEAFAEAHNNLAYVLRKQGAAYFDEALRHYNRAIQLNPDLPEPYMYRGVLYVQMDRRDLAENDYRKLAGMDSGLSEELRYVIDNGREREPERFFGVSGKIN